MTLRIILELTRNALVRKGFVVEATTEDTTPIWYDAVRNTLDNQVKLYAQELGGNFWYNFNIYDGGLWFYGKTSKGEEITSVDVGEVLDLLDKKEEPRSSIKVGDLLYKFVNTWVVVEEYERDLICYSLDDDQRMAFKPDEISEFNRGILPFTFVLLNSGQDPCKTVYVKRREGGLRHTFKELSLSIDLSESKTTVSLYFGGNIIPESYATYVMPSHNHINPAWLKVALFNTVKEAYN